MAFEEKVGFISEPASGDLSASQFCLVALGTTGVAKASAQGQRVDGVLYNEPAALGRAAQVAVSGTARVKAGAVIALGAKVTTTAAGLAETASSGDYIIGVAREAATASGDIIALEITKDGAL